MIYLDNAATTMQKPEAVAEAVVAAMGSMGNSGRGAEVQHFRHQGSFMMQGFI